MLLLPVLICFPPPHNTKWVLATSSLATATFQRRREREAHWHLKAKAPFRFNSISHCHSKWPACSFMEANDQRIMKLWLQSRRLIMLIMLCKPWLVKIISTCQALQLVEVEAFLMTSTGRKITYATEKYLDHFFYLSGTDYVTATTHTPFVL